jgi:hypothetical protein
MGLLAVLRRRSMRVGTDPSLGLTEADLARWPGREMPKRAKLIPRIEEAIAAGAVELPVRVVGKCVAYDPKDGHPAFPKAIHYSVDFVVSGHSQPIVTTFRKHPDPISGFDIDEMLIEKVPTDHGGFLDLQFQSDAGRPGRIGFLFSHGGEQVAQDCVELVAAALKAVVLG